MADSEPAHPDSAAFVQGCHPGDSRVHKGRRAGLRKKRAARRSLSLLFSSFSPCSRGSWTCGTTRSAALSPPSAGSRCGRRAWPARCGRSSRASRRRRTRRCCTSRRGRSCRGAGRPGRPVWGGRARTSGPSRSWRPSSGAIRRGRRERMVRGRGVRERKEGAGARPHQGSAGVGARAPHSPSCEAGAGRRPTAAGRGVWLCVPGAGPGRAGAGHPRPGGGVRRCVSAAAGPLSFSGRSPSLPHPLPLPNSP